MTRWEPIENFEDYLVSDSGLVSVSVSHNRTLSYHRNQRGILSVVLRKNGVQYRRSVSGLVARAFLEPSEHGEMFDTPIHLDGDRDNCYAYNLMWRPRWFAIRYHRQFKLPPLPGWYTPVQDLDSGYIYESLIDAAMTNGFLMRGLIPNPDGVIDRSPWPTSLKLAYIIKSDTK